jgi:ribosomal protein S18 acetylase RimI-like enzyme
MPMLSPALPALESIQHRQAGIGDAASLCEFARRIFVETFAPSNTPENMDHYVQRAFTTQQIQSELEDTSNIFILLEHEQKLVAYYKLQTVFDRTDASIPESILNNKSILLERFYLDAEWQGSGLAQHMMHHCIELVQSLNQDLIWLGVWEHNPKARRFYEKQGFQVVGSHIFMMGNQAQTDHWMSLSLQSTNDALQIIEVNESLEQYLDAAKILFREYQESRGLPLDFQNFDKEIDSLPAKFVPPSGALYVAFWGQQPVGCVAFYEWGPGICELKRLFVKPETQGKSIGRKLMERAILDAKNAGYRFMRLDSLRRFEAAGNLYPKLGFYDIPPYNENPYDDVYYMQLDL